MVEITASWCMDCLAMAPIIKEARTEFKELAFETHDIKSKDAKKFKEYLNEKSGKTVQYILFDKEGDYLLTYTGSTTKEAAFEQFKFLNDGTLSAEVKKFKAYFADLKGKQDAARRADAATAKKQPKLSINHKNLPTAVFYYADWCPYCRKMTPILDKAEAKYSGKVFFHKVNVDLPENKAFVAKHRLKRGGIPYFQYYDKKGKFVKDSIGATDETSLFSYIDAII